MISIAHFSLPENSSTRSILAPRGGVRNRISVPLTEQRIACFQSQILPSFLLTPGALKNHYGFQYSIVYALGASVAVSDTTFIITILSYILHMRTVMLNIPDNVDIDSNEIAMLVATKLYEQGKLSLGQAAELVGMTKRTFAELLGRYNVSLFNYPSSDLAKDVSKA